MTILKIKDRSYSKDLIKKRRSKIADGVLETYVSEIIDEVQRKGDRALLNFTKKFDKVDLTITKVRVSKNEIKAAYTKVSNEEINALKCLKAKIEKVERRKLERINYTIKEKGLKIVHRCYPLESVGCYVPGGEAAYPSSLLMTVIPAKVAGIPRIVVCSPPTCEGEINPLILVAASICEVNEVYRLGGVHAIAALAYGTESVKPVSKIVGAGNKYVALAKILVSKDVGIDLPAGPSEMIVLADDTAEPKFIAIDMISQSEHAPDNIAGLVTTSEDLALKVVDEVERVALILSRREIVKKSLLTNGFVFVYKTMDKAISFVNAFAPEHLEIVTRKPEKIAEKISSAGIILLGEYTPVSVSDYCVGTNHVLPTAGFSKIYSELSIFDYIRRVNIVKCSKKRLQKMQNLAKIFADSERLPNHFKAIEARFEDAQKFELVKETYRRNTQNKTIFN